MKMKSVIAGEYTAPPAHGPITALSCGITPLASVLRRKMSAYPASDATPSWMRAPPESFKPMTGAPLRMARSMILQIFCALVSESEPPNTVKSCAKTYTRRPSMRPNPVTNPSPMGRVSAEPKSTQRWRTNLSSSSNVPSSSKRCIRSRAESLPALCWRSRRSVPPPASASADILRSCSRRSAFTDESQVRLFFSAKRSSLGRVLLWSEDQHGQMSGKPHGTQKKNHSQEDFRGNRARARQGRGDRRHVERGAFQDHHGAQRHGHDHQRRQNGGENLFHKRLVNPLKRQPKHSAFARKSERVAGQPSRTFSRATILMLFKRRSTLSSCGVRR